MKNKEPGPMLVSFKPPKKGMAKLRELARTHGRASEEYKAAVKEVALQMTQALPQCPRSSSKK